MKARFVHLADVHLGFEQYGLKERFNDFARAWDDALQQAVDRKVDFVLIAGDLFHKRTVEPMALLQASSGLDKLRAAGIPAVAVEGNHERIVYGQEFSWMQYLAWQGCFRLLSPITAKGEIALDPCDEETGRGGYVDLNGVRIAGQQYLGATAPAVLEKVAKRLEELPPAEFTVYMMHAGMEGIVPNYPGCVTYEQVQPIRPFVQYLALGHVHIRFDREGWLFNPGSLETCSVDEVGEDRGFYLVDVDTERAPAIQATLLTPRRRPFLRFRVDAGQARTPGELEALVQAAVRPHIDSTGTISDPGGWSAGSARDPTGEWNKPVVDLCLRGTLRFDRKDLDLNALEMIASRALNALHVEVKNQAVPRDFQSNDGGPVSRQELERRTLEALFMNDTRYQPDAGHWAEVAAEIKRMAVSGAEPETLAQFLEQSLPVGHE